MGKEEIPEGRRGGPAAIKGVLEEVQKNCFCTGCSAPKRLRKGESTFEKRREVVKEKPARNA